MGEWVRQNQTRLRLTWGKHEALFEPSEPESSRRDVPNADVRIADGATSRSMRLRAKPLSSRKTS
jgi:hypothetical protein